MFGQSTWLGVAGLLVTGCGPAAPWPSTPATAAGTPPAEARTLPGRCDRLAEDIEQWGLAWPRRGEHPATGCPAPSLEGAVSVWSDRAAPALADLKGGPVLICFWASYSEPSRRALAHLKKQAEPELAMIAVSVDAPGDVVEANDLQSFVEDLGLNDADVRWMSKPQARKAVIERFAADDSTIVLVDDEGVVRHVGHYRDLYEADFEARLEGLR